MAATVLPHMCVALFLAACTSEPGDRGNPRADTNSASGINVVDPAPLWTDQTAWHLEEDLRLGQVESEGPDQFGMIGRVMIDEHGLIHVLDMLSQDIRVFNPDGSFSHRIGRKGDGPGEFREAAAMTMGPGDTLWVVDPPEARYSAFGPDGRFLRSIPRRILRSGDWPGRFLSDGRYLDWGFDQPDGINAKDARIVLYPIILSQGFQNPDSMPFISYTHRMAEVEGKLQPAVFFSRDLLYEVDGHGRLWFAVNEQYRLFRRDLDGDTTLTVTMSAEPSPINESDREVVRKRMALRPELTDAYLAALPETRPIINRLIADRAGHLYVIADLAGHAPGTVLDVFRTDDGQYLGRLELPQPVPLQPRRLLVGYATADHLLFVVLDENNTPFISRLRIVRPVD